MPYLSREYGTTIVVILEPSTVLRAGKVPSLWASLLGSEDWCFTRPKISASIAALKLGVKCSARAKEDNLGATPPPINSFRRVDSTSVHISIP